MKKIIRLSLVFCVVFFRSAFAQNTFQIEYNYSNNDAFYACLENTQGNYVLAGHVENTGTNTDIVLMELSPSGAILNSSVLATNEFEMVKSITQTMDGGYFLCGVVFSSPNDFDWMVARLDGAFNIVWRHRFFNSAGNDNANSAFEISPGHFVVVGSAFIGGATKPSIVTLDNNGSVIQQNFYETNQFASPEYRGKRLDNGVIGINRLSNGLCLVDTVGNLINNWPNSSGYYSQDVIKTNSGRYALINELGSGPISTAVGLTILSQDLSAVIANRSYSDLGDNLQPVAIMEGNNGELFMAVNFSSNSTGNYNPLLIHTDSVGAMFSCHNYNPSTTLNSTVNAAVRTSDGGFLLVGSAGEFGQQHLYAVKTDALGNACSSSTQSLNISFPATSPSTVHAPFSGNVTSPVAEVSLLPAAQFQANVLCLVTGEAESLGERIFLLNNIGENGWFHFSSPLPSNAIFRCYDLSGKLLLEKRILTSEKAIQTNINQGLYLVEIMEDSGKILLHQKVIQY